MPATKSRYSAPSASTMVQPWAWSTASWENRAMDCRPGAMISASWAKIAFDRGPGTGRGSPILPWAMVKGWVRSSAMGA